MHATYVKSWYCFTLFLTMRSEYHDRNMRMFNQQSCRLMRSLSLPFTLLLPLRCYETVLVSASISRQKRGKRRQRTHPRRTRNRQKSNWILCLSNKLEERRKLFSCSPHFSLLVGVIFCVVSRHSLSSWNKRVFELLPTKVSSSFCCAPVVFILLNPEEHLSLSSFRCQKQKEISETQHHLIKQRLIQRHPFDSIWRLSFYVICLSSCLFALFSCIFSCIFPCILPCIFSTRKRFFSNHHLLRSFFPMCLLISSSTKRT